MSLSTLQLGMGASRTAMSGTDRYFLDLLRALPGTGVSVRGLVAGEPEALDNPVPNVVSFSPLDAPRMQRWQKARRAVRELVSESDVVVSHCSFAAFPVLDILRDRPLVVQFHGPWALESKAEGKGQITYYVRRLQELLNYRKAERFIVLSRAFGEILADEYDIDWDRIRVIPGGVALERFSALPTKLEARELLGWPIDRPIVSTVRRLVPSKGVGGLIDAIDIVRKSIPDIFCAVVGTGPLAAELKTRIAERDLPGFVHLAGHVSDEVLNLVYRASDLFVVPTLAFEGFGLAVLEALACGTPTLVTPIGGLTEAVEGLSSNLILSGTSVAEIARGITEALNGLLTIPTSDECMAYAKLFDWNVIASRVGDVYREVV